MKFLKMHGPLLRAVGVVSAVGVLVTGVTFATLQSQQAVLSGNTIQSATADLRIGTSASTFSASRTGFSFENVVPGGPAMPADGYAVYLKNYGTASLSLKLVAGGSLTNTSTVDLSKVKLQLTRVDTNVAQTVDMQTLTTTGLALTDPIAPSAVVQYKLRVSMDADAFTGAAATIGGIDLVYSGAAAN